MPWFYYSGNVPRSVQVKKGLSIALKPHSKVEIFDVNTPEVKALKKKGDLRLTSKPKGAVSLKDAPTMSAKDVEKVTPKSNLAKVVAEKGVTGKKGQTPKSKKPEMTEGETQAASKNKPVEESKPDTKGSDVEKAEDVDVLSNAESGPDGDGDGKKKKARKGRGRKGQ